MRFHQLQVAMIRYGVEVQVHSTATGFEAWFVPGIPVIHHRNQMRVIHPGATFGQRRLYGPFDDPGKEGQFLVKDTYHRIDRSIDAPLLWHEKGVCHAGRQQPLSTKHVGGCLGLVRIRPILGTVQRQLF